MEAILNTVGVTILEIVQEMPGPWAAMAAGVEVAEVVF